MFRLASLYVIPALLILGLTSLPAPASAQSPSEVWLSQKILPTKNSWDNRFGTHVILRGDVAFIADPGDAHGLSYNGTTCAPSMGAVYVYTKTNGMWRRSAALMASDATEDAIFGQAISVSADGNTVAIGAPTGQPYMPWGKAYVFHKSANGKWVQVAEFSAGNKYVWDFGAAVALSGDTLMVGAPNSVVDGALFTGGVMVYHRVNGTWKQESRLLPTDNKSGHPEFGFPITLVGAYAFIGAEGTNDMEGAVYVFSDSSGSWSQTQHIKAIIRDPDPHSGFGYTITPSGYPNTVFISEPGYGPLNSGRIFQFNRVAGLWNHTQTLAPVIATTGTGFYVAYGRTVANDGDTMLSDINSIGVSMIQKVNGSWEPTVFFPDINSIHFGDGEAVSGDTVLIGNPMDTNLQEPHSVRGLGAAYFYTKSQVLLNVNAPQEVASGSTYTSQVSVTNLSVPPYAPINGGPGQTPVSVNIPIPNGTTLVSATPNQGSCSTEAQSVQCDLGPVSRNGGTANVAVELNVTVPSGKSITNSASISNAVPALEASAITSVRAALRPKH